MKNPVFPPAGRSTAWTNLLRWQVARHFGWPALAALALGGLAAWLALQWLPRLTAEHERVARLREQRIAAQRLAGAAAPVSDEAASVQWLRALPPVAQRGRSLAQFLQRAKAAGLRVDHADYVGDDDPALPLARTTVTLPMSGTYAQLRTGVASMLAELPSAALLSLQIERSDTRTPQLRATAQFVLHFRRSPP